ncbi:MAG: hypothetical protein ABIN61_05080 [candidate division WOR-3 bacterium]
MKNRILILIFFSFPFYAELIKFSGYTTLYGEYNDINGDTLIEPTTQMRFFLNPTISIAEMPISFELCLSSLESKARQALNKYRISIQPEKLLKEKANLPSFIFSISNIEFGTCYPYFSSLTLSGIPLTGGVFELNPGIFHLEGAKGTIQRGVTGSDSTFTEYAYERSMFAFTLGLGRKENSHLHFIFLHGIDDTNSVSPYFIPLGSDTDSVEVLKPMENYLLGALLKLSFFNNKFNIESEFVGSELVRDIRTPELPSSEIPSFIKNLLHPKISSSFDLAFLINSSLTIYNTEISGSLTLVGPGFFSFGNPYQRNDLLSYKGGLKQNLFNNTLFLFASLSKEKDNLIGIKGSTTAFQTHELGIGFNFSDFPSIQFSYSPYSEKNDSINLDRKCDMFSINTGYNYNFMNLNNNTTLFLSYQNYEDTNDSSNYSGKAISLYHDISFIKPLTISFEIDFSETNYPDTVEKTLSLDFGTYYTFLEKLTNGIGVNISKEKETSKKGLYLNSSLSTKFLGNLTLEVERNFYSGKLEKENYDEWRIIGSASRKW